MNFQFPNYDNRRKVFVLLQELEEIASDLGWDTPASIDYYFDVDFDLSGVRCAGRAGYNHLDMRVWMSLHGKALETLGFDKYKNTVIHEFAHILQYLNFPKVKQAHGKEFRTICKVLGGNGKTYSSYDLYSVEGRKRRKKTKITRKPYKCGCRVHNITLHRIAKIKKGSVYTCIHCNEEIKAA